jgi:HAD superfamily hydrolase (TIGR01490 family)
MLRLTQGTRDRGALRLVEPQPRIAEAAFFDLDRTLVPGSSLFPLAREMRRRGVLTVRRVARLGVDQVRFRLRGEDDVAVVERVRESALASIRGLEHEWVLEVARGVVSSWLLPRVYPQAAFLAHAHRWTGRAVYLVTSAPEDYAALLAEALGMDGALGTRAEVVDGRYTGGLLGAVNRGVHKAARIRLLAAERGIDLSRSYAYGDSASDLPMLRLVGHPVAVNPDRSLADVAARSGWQMLEFRSRAAARRREPTPPSAVLSGLMHSVP